MVPHPCDTRGFKTSQATQRLHRYLTGISHRLEGPACDEGRPRSRSPEWVDQGVLDAVVHDEDVGARVRGDVAVRPMHRVAVEEHRRTGRTGELTDASLGGQPGEAGLVGRANF